MKKTNMTTSNDISEAAIQSKIVRWYRNTHCLKHHNPRCMVLSVPNENKGPRAAALINTGLYSGCADLILIHNFGLNGLNGFIILFIEVKTQAGVQSTKQKAFQEHCLQMGIRYRIVRSLDEFRQVIEKL